MLNKTKIRLLSFAGILMLAITIVSFVFVLHFSTGKNTYKSTEQMKGSTQDTKGSNDYNILSMGDSVANGTGDVQGKGFAKNYADALQKTTKKTVKVNNLAVNGDTSDGLLEIVKNEKTKSIIEQADIIFLSIGGNEIKKFVDYNDMESNNDYEAVKNKYLTNLTTILSILRSENKTCVIGFVGLYNPYGDHLANEKIELLEDWNYETQKLLLKDENVFYIPTFDLFQYNQKNYLTIDSFHPNSDGYQAIANRIGEILKTVVPK